MQTRRTFIKTSVVALAANSCFNRNAKTGYNAHGLPVRRLGQTGVKIPPIAFGTGSRYCAVENEETALGLLEYALDHGFYYWDTAAIYENRKCNIVSEERLGKILKNRRSEVFLSTKVTDRDPDAAMRQIETSLKRLQTDHLDILQLHGIFSVEEVDQLGKPGQLIDILYRLKSEGITRFIGFTGHKSATAMKTMAERYDFDTMLIALNHYRKGKEAFEQEAVPAAAKKGMGVMVMKVIRPRETVETVSPKDLVRYVLSLEHASGAVIGMDNLDVLKKNIALARDFTPLSRKEMKSLEMSLHPFFNGHQLAWMRPDYIDGHWA